MNAELIRAANTIENMSLTDVHLDMGAQADCYNAAVALADFVRTNASDYGEDGEPLEVTAEFCWELGLTNDPEDMERWSIEFGPTEVGVYLIASEGEPTGDIYVMCDGSGIDLPIKTRPQLRSLLAALGG